VDGIGTAVEVVVCGGAVVDVVVDDVVALAAGVMTSRRGRPLDVPRKPTAAATAALATTTAVPMNAATRSLPLSMTCCYAAVPTASFWASPRRPDRGL
jgi:hypothetical protein